MFLSIRVNKVVVVVGCGGQLDMTTSDVCKRDLSSYVAYTILRYLLNCKSEV